MDREIAEHYSSGYEQTRLQVGAGPLEAVRTRELLERFLPKPPATVLDIGGGPGAHASHLADNHFDVHLIDIVPLHVEMARRIPNLKSVEVGDARSLPYDDRFADAALMLGPLYHLTDPSDRSKALTEARRVLKPGGRLMAVGISRFASSLDGLHRDLLLDPKFRKIWERDVDDGHHINDTGNPEYFMDTFFHHPDELRAEVIAAGFTEVELIAVEGPGWVLPDLDRWLDDGERQKVLLDTLRKLEQETTLMGGSAHVMAVGINSSEGG